MTEVFVEQPLASPGSANKQCLEAKSAGNITQEVVCFDGFLYRGSQSSLLMDKIEGSQTRVLEDMTVQSFQQQKCPKIWVKE